LPEKSKRRKAILDAAQSLYEKRGFAGSTMSTLAQQVGVAKGTLYLYFQTKEEVFLALTREGYAAWFDAVEAALEAADGGTLSVEQVVAIMTDALVARPVFVRLLAQLHTTLEQNIEYDAALRFKRFLRERLAVTGAQLERVLPFLGKGEAATVLAQTQVVAIGAQHMSSPAPVIRKVFDAEPDLGFFQFDFPVLFSETLTALLQGRSVSPPSATSL
jgi:AcrR family transcriptional regulator